MVVAGALFPLRSGSLPEEALVLAVVNDLLLARIHGVLVAGLLLLVASSLDLCGGIGVRVTRRFMQSSFEAQKQRQLVSKKREALDSVTWRRRHRFVRNFTLKKTLKSYWLFLKIDYVT